MLSQYSWDNIAQEKLLFSVVLILLGQLELKTLSITQETPSKTVHEKGQCIVVWTASLFGNLYFGPVNFLIKTGCCKCCANLAQISTILSKKNPGPTLNEKARLYETQTAMHWFFPVYCCLESFGQYFTGLLQQHIKCCAMLFGTTWTTFQKVFILYNVVPGVLRQRWTGFFSCAVLSRKLRDQIT